MTITSQDPSANPLIIHVIARLKPTQCGLSDFALAIAGEMEAKYGIRSAFAIVNSDLPCEVPYRIVYRRQSELLEACRSLSEGRPATLLVHLSGYGFSRDGAPAELAGALANVRKSGEFQIAVYFHELFATGMPWRSAFWYTRRQQSTIRRIAQECDLLVTNSEHHARWLEQETVRRSKHPIQILPVLSNAGESSFLTPVDKRRPSLVIFGLAANRRIAYDRLSKLNSLLDDLGIEDVLDIGPPFDAPVAMHGRPIEQMGIIPVSELADRLAHAKFGFVKHPAFTLAKSGIFAAYCAHGVIPLVPDPFPVELDGLKDGLQAISPRTVKEALIAGLQRSSSAAWEWYSRHSLHVHAAAYARLLTHPQSALDAVGF